MKWTSIQRSSFENRERYEGIGVRPRVIFQKSAPSVCWVVADELKSPGFTRRSGALGPSPRPVLPWHATHSCRYITLPRAIFCSAFGTGFETRLALAGTFHEVGACDGASA